VDGGFFSSKYTTYTLKTSPFDWTVKRRYSDFEKIRELLSKLFPGFVIPPLPSKKFGNKRFEMEFITKRMAFLQKFIDLILSNEYFKSSELLLCFLNQADRNTFDNKLKELSGFTTPLYVEDFKTFDGKLKILFNDEIEGYFNGLKDYNQFTTTLAERLNLNFKLFSNHTKEAMKCLDEIRQDLDYMHRLNAKVNNKKEIGKFYDEFKGFMGNWMTIYDEQQASFKTYFKNFF